MSDQDTFPSFSLLVFLSSCQNHLLSVMLTATEELGCARNANGQLKEASDMSWPNSPSDEARDAKRAMEHDRPISPSVAHRTRGRTNGNVKAVGKEVAKKPKSKKSKSRKNKRSKTKEVSSDVEVTDGSASDEDEDAEKMLEHLDVLALGDRQITRSRSSQTADIRLIFTPEVRIINGKEEKGHVCTICMYDDREKPQENKTWYVGGNSTLRGHIARNKNHYTKYIELCRKNNIEPNGRALPAELTSSGPTQIILDGFVQHHPIYTKEGLLDLLIKLVVTDDQSFRLVDKPEFRDILLFLRPTTRDRDIPHRTFLQEKILDKARETVQNIKLMFQQVKGLVSFTFDTWTSRARDPYIAVTAHYIFHPPGRPMEWTLNNTVIGFSFISGDHGGENLARIITRAINRFDLKNKIGWFTSDNATVNDRVMVELSLPGMAANDTLDYNPQERRIRCAAHVLNLAARAFIEGISPTPAASIRKKLSGYKRKYSSIFEEDTDDEEELDVDEVGFDALEIPVPLGDDEEAPTCNISDLVGKVLAFVVQVRASPQASAYFGESCLKKGIKPLKLVTWVRTRWSSMYNVLLRLQMLQPAVDFFFLHADRTNKVPKLSKGRTYAMYAISKEEWKILEKVTDVLKDTAQAQHSFSSETVPTIWRNLPMLEYLQTRWEAYNASDKYACLRPGLERGLEILNKYYKLTDETSVNLVCHVLDPTMKMGYIKKKWDAVWIGRAKNTITRIVESYYQQYVEEVPVEETPQQPKMDIAENNKSLSGFASAWMKNAIHGEDNPKVVCSYKAELDNYLKSPPENGIEDVLGWWGRHAADYPTLARIARDYLAIQGSAVASERCFSSGGITGTDRRNRIGPVTFEALQILKNAYKNTGLFTPPTVLGSMEAESVYVEPETDPFITI